MVSMHSTTRQFREILENNQTLNQIRLAMIKNIKEFRDYLVIHQKGKRRIEFTNYSQCNFW